MYLLARAITVIFLAGMLPQVEAAAEYSSLRLKGDVNSSYYTNGKHVFYRVCNEEKPSCYILLPDSDPKTFRMADPENFSSYYVLDGQHVYSVYQLVQGADPSTFELLGDGYMHDKNNVFSGFSKLALDVKKAHLLGAGYITDGKSVFYREKKLRRVRAQSFVSYPSENAQQQCGHDERLVFCEHRIVPKLNPHRFVSLFPFIMKDDKTALCGTKVLKVDVPSFTVLSSTYAKDAKHIYAFGVYGRRCRHFFAVPHADVTSFEVITHNGAEYSQYGKDKLHVFYEGKVIPNADPATFDPDIYWQQR